MRFHYNPALKRSEPYIVDAEEWVTKNNFEEINNWVKKNRFPVLGFAKDYFIMIDVPVSEFDDVTTKLYNKRFLFEWDDD